MDTLREFLERGSLGPIALGLSPADVRQLLGEPEATGGKSTRKIWKHGPLQIGFQRDPATQGQVVHFIGLYLNGESGALPAAIRLEGWFPGPNTNKDELVRYLTTHGISFSEEARLISDTQYSLTTASGASIVFDVSAAGVFLDSIQLVCASKVAKPHLTRR